MNFSLFHFSFWALKDFHQFALWKWQEGIVLCCSTPLEKDEKKTSIPLRQERAFGNSWVGYLMMFTVEVSTAFNNMCILRTYLRTSSILQHLKQFLTCIEIILLNKNFEHETFNIFIKFRIRLWNIWTMSKFSLFGLEILISLRFC